MGAMNQGCLEPLDYTAVVNEFPKSVDTQNRCLKILWEDTRGPAFYVWESGLVASKVSSHWDSMIWNEDVQTGWKGK